MVDCHRTSDETERTDIYGLRRIMLELMEPRVCEVQEELQYPERWESDRTGIVDFLRATTESSLSELRSVSSGLFLTCGISPLIAQFSTKNPRLGAT